MCQYFGKRERESHKRLNRKLTDGGMRELKRENKKDIERSERD